MICYLKLCIALVRTFDMGGGIRSKGRPRPRYQSEQTLNLNLNLNLHKLPDRGPNMTFKYPLHTQQYIHGQWVDSKSSERMTLRSALDDAVITEGDGLVYSAAEYVLKQPQNSSALAQRTSTWPWSRRQRVSGLGSPWHQFVSPLSELQHRLLIPVKGSSPGVFV